MNKFIKISFFIYILLLPSYLIKVPFGNSFALPFLDALSFVFVSLSLPGIWQSHSFAKFIKSFPGRGFAFLSLILLGFALSYLFNINASYWQDGLGIIKSFVVLPFISSLVFVHFEKTGFLKIKDVVLPLAISSGVSSFLGYFYIISGGLTYDSRLKMFFESPNQLSIYLSIGLLCTALTIKNGLLKNKLLLFVFLLFVFSQTFCLYFTRSLGSLIGLLAASPLLLSQSKLLYVYRKIIISLVLILSCLIFSTGTIMELTTYTQPAPATSIDSRITIYSVSQKIIEDNFLWGIGPGNFQKVYLDYQKYFPPYPQWAVPHAHNNLLHFFVEGGFLALLGLVFVIFFLITTKKQPTLKMSAVYLILAYLLVHGIFDTTIWKNDLSIVFWLFTSLAIFEKNRSEPDPV